VPMLEDRVLDVLSTLETADLGVRLRKPLPTFDGSQRSCEVDLWLPRSALGRVQQVLRPQGFHHFRAPGQGSHHFYLGLDDGRWIKLDAKVDADAEQHDRSRSAPVSLYARTVEGLRRRRPLSPRRMGPVIALVGPDGAGKGTIISGLDSAIPVATITFYFGLPVRRRRPASSEPPPTANAGSSREPTTAPDPGPRGWRRRFEALLVLKGLLWQTRVLLRAYVAAWQGKVVLCDRHPVEVLAIDPRHTRLARSLERAIVRRVLPWPDRIVVLDAPAAAMFARKGEHTVERLERWRRGFRDAFQGPGAAIIDTSASVDTATLAASDVVWKALAERRRW
jgi:thymidylate kinase